jgi:hypothetical protein
MAQQDVLAKVWILLQTRIDICSIIREVLGHYTLASVGGSASTENAFSFFVWMKVIYDLQRTYSQSSDPSPESRSYLLPPRILLTTIHYVLKEGSRLYSHQHGADKRSLARRYFVARVLLSGLRALQLRGMESGGFSTQEIDEISTFVHIWRSEAGGITQEQFMLTKCQGAISQIRRGPGPGDIWHMPASGTCNLRDNHDVLVSRPVLYLGLLRC